MKFLRLILLLVMMISISCSQNGNDPEPMENENSKDNPDSSDSDTDEDTNTEDDNTDNDSNSDDDDSSMDTKEDTDGVKYGDNFIVFEPQITTSDLGLWKKRVPEDSKYHVGTGIEAINRNYLEFTGNNLNSGPPTSPLEYNFKCPKSGKYRLVMRMYQPLAEGEAGDKRNDVWIKLAGDFTTACVYPTEELKKNHKFWGRGVRKWGSTYNLEGHVNGVKKLAKVVYNLKEGEIYTFTMSGRAQGCSLDYILLYEESLNFNIVQHTDLAEELPELYRPDVAND